MLVSQKEFRKNRGQLVNIAVIIASIVVILAGIHAAKAILSPIFMATFVAVLLLPALTWLQSKGFSQISSLTIVILSVLCGGVIMTTILGNQLASFVGNIPVYKQRFNEELMKFNLSLDDFFPSMIESTEEPTEEKGQEKPIGGVFQPSEKESNHRAARNTESESFSLQISSPEQGSRRGDLLAQDVGAVDSVTREVSLGSLDAGDAMNLKNSLNSNARLVNVSFSESATPLETLSESANLSDIPKETPVAGLSETSESSSIPLATEPSEYPDHTSSNGSSSSPSTSSSTKTPDESHSTRGFFDSEKQPTGFFDSASSSTTQQAPETLLGQQPDNGTEDGQSGEEDLSDPENNDINSVWSENAVQTSSRELFRFLSSLMGELSSLVSSAFIIMLLAIFMLIEASKLPLKMVVARGKKSLTSEHVRDVIHDIRRYMIIKTFVSIIVGFCVTVLLVFSNVQYPLLWGFIAFLLNYIPNIGSVVAAIPPVVLATIEHGILIGGVDAVFFVIINCVVGYILEPKLLGDGLDLSPLVVLLSLICCGWLLGPVGMFLSPPLAVITKIILQSFPETRWIAVLMAHKVPREDEFQPEES